MSRILSIALLAACTSSEPTRPGAPEPTAVEPPDGPGADSATEPTTDTVDGIGDTAGWCDPALPSATGTGGIDTALPADSSASGDTSGPDSTSPTDTAPPVTGTTPADTGPVGVPPTDTSPVGDTPLVDSGESADTSLYPQVGCGSLDRLYQYGDLADEWPWMMTGTPDGGFVLVGELASTIVFGAGEPNETTISSTGYDDAFITKYASGGTVEWAQHISAAVNVRARAVAVAVDGTIAVTGPMSSAATVAPTAEALPLAYRGSGADADVFVAVFEADGTPRWAHSIGGLGYDDYGGVAIGNDGAVYVTGTYEEPGVEVGPVGSRVFLDNTTDDLHSFLVRFESDGAIGWSRIISGEGDEVPQGLEVLPAGNILVAGYLDEAITFSEGEVDEVVHDPGSGTNTMHFLASYAPDGSLAWWQTPGTLDAGGGPYGTAASATGAWLHGLAGNEVVFGAGEPNEFVFPLEAHTYVSSFAEDGTLDWVRLVHMTGGTSSSAVDGAYRAASGRYAVAGLLGGEWSFTDENGNVLSGHAGWTSTDPFAAAYNADGELECLFVMPSNTDYVIEEARPVYIDDLGGLWVAAMFSGQLQVAPGTPEETVLTSVGAGTDILLARFILPGGYPLP